MRRVEKPEFESFEWDAAKRQGNIRKSGIDFVDAARALLSAHLEMSSDRAEEPRTMSLCGASGRVIVVIFTMRQGNCRIISAWPADKNEQRRYREIFGG